MFLASDHVVVNGCTSRPGARQGHEKEWYDIVLPRFFFLFSFVLSLTWVPTPRRQELAR